MPLSHEVEIALDGLAAVSGDHVLFGIFLNPQTGECGTYSSHGVKPGKVLAFLQDTVEQMITAAANNELQYVGGNDAEMAGKAGRLVH